MLYTQLLTNTCVLTIYVHKKRLSELKLGNSLKTRHEDQDYNNIFGIGIPDIFVNMFSCQGFINNNDSIVILICPNRLSQYYFNKVFTQLKCDEDHLKKNPELVKETVGAVLKENTDLVMLCRTTITSTSSTMKNLYVGTQYHSLYSTDNYSDQI